MHSNTNSKKDKEQTEPPYLCHKHSAVDKRNPYKAHRNNLNAQRNGFILAKILYIDT